MYKFLDMETIPEKQVMNARSPNVAADSREGSDEGSANFTTAHNIDG